MNICSIDACQKKSRYHKMCVMHFKRMKRNGDPLVSKTGHIPQTLDSLLRSDTDDCLRWPYYHSKKGRPCATIKKKTSAVARLLLSMKTGINPKKIDAAHKCGHKWCVNVRHMYWATRKQNESDKIAHGTYFNKTSKITAEQASEIFTSTGSAKSVAENHGILPGTVWQIRRGDTWGRYTANLPLGVKRPHKLTDEQAIEIFLSTGALKTVAQRYGTSQSNVSLIRRGKTWSRVTGCLIRL